MAVSGKAQIAVPNTTPVTENFNSMGSAGTALPSNWKISNAGGGTAAAWTTGTNATAVSVTTCTANSTTGGSYNFGVSAACTDRYVGFMTSGSFSTTNCIMSAFQNTNATTLSSITVSYDVRKFRDNTATFNLTLYFSTDGITWTSVQTYSLAAGTNTYFQSAPPTVTQTVSISLCVATSSNFYLKWNFDTPGSSSSKGIGIDNFSLTASFSGCSGSGYCPSLTGFIADACNNGCNEGDAEVMFFNTGSYPVTVSSLPSHVVNYYGGVSSYTAGTINNYTGTFAANASTTSTLNSSTGCSGSFIDAATAGTIPANATVMMVPSTFCSANYDFSNICSGLSPIYVLYFSTTGWSSSGTLANNQTPSPKPKYLTVDFSSVSGSCPMQYYTFDADTEKNGDGAGVAYPGSISTSSVTPISPSAYTSATCTLPLVLPANLVSFTAVRTYTYEAELKFTTIGEENVRSFILSKSYDGLHYYTFAEKDARNEVGTYTYTGYDEIDGSFPAIYYRLEEEDMDGVRKILGNCVLQMSGGKEISYTFTDEAIWIHSPEGIRGAALYSIEGALIASQGGSDDKLEYQLITAGCRAGFYLLYITDVYGKTAVKKILR